MVFKYSASKKRATSSEPSMIAAPEDAIVSIPGLKMDIRYFPYEISYIWPIKDNTTNGRINLNIFIKEVASGINLGAKRKNKKGSKNVRMVKMIPEKSIPSAKEYINSIHPKSIIAISDLLK
jgi:hypothetical protein